FRERDECTAVPRHWGELERRWNAPSCDGAERHPQWRSTTIGYQTQPRRSFRERIRYGVARRGSRPERRRALPRDPPAHRVRGLDTAHREAGFRDAASPCLTCVRRRDITGEPCV